VADTDSPPTLLYDDIVVGTEYEILADPVERDDVARYLRACGQQDVDLYGDTVPPLMLALIKYLKESLAATWPPGGLHAGEKISVLDRLPLGTPFRVRTRVVDKHPGRRHRFVSFDIEVTTEDTTCLHISRRLTWAA